MHLRLQDSKIFFFAIVASQIISAYIRLGVCECMWLWILMSLKSLPRNFSGFIKSHIKNQGLNTCFVAQILHVGKACTMHNKTYILRMLTHCANTSSSVTVTHIHPSEIRFSSLHASNHDRKLFSRVGIMLC